MYFLTDELTNIKYDYSSIYSFDFDLGGTEDAILVDAAGVTCDIITSGKVVLINSPSVDDALDIINKCNYVNNTVFIFNNPDFKQCSSKRIFMKYETEIASKRIAKHADYSSTGPANRGIRKPDLVAPGTRIVSANSKANNTKQHGCLADFQADYTFMSGTSMATPNVAGAAALVREYFREKWEGGKVILDGTTVRALLINSCIHPDNLSFPDDFLGHGYVDLSTILPFEDNTFGVSITPQDIFELKHNEVKGTGAPTIDQFSQVVSELKVESGHKLQVTMSYIDVTPAMESPHGIVRDLDLIVESPSGILYKGDHLPDGDTQHLSTNEKVIIDNPESGTYLIRVFSHGFIDESFSKEQKFSVVATGNIVNQVLQFKVPETCGKMVCDDNHPLHFRCDDDKVGPICQDSIIKADGDSIKVNLQPHQIARIRFHLKKNYFQIISTSADPGQQFTVRADKKCFSGLSEYSIVEATLTDEAANQTRSSTYNLRTKEICVAIFNNNPNASSYSIKIEYKNYVLLFVVITVLCVGIIAAVIIVLIIYCKRKKLASGAYTQFDRNTSDNRTNEHIICTY